MKEFLALYSFNYKRMISTWMIRAIILVIMGGVLAGIFIIKEENKTESVGVVFSGESYETEERLILELLNQTNRSFEYKIAEEEVLYDNTMEIEIQKDAAGSMTVLIYTDNDEYFTEQAKEIICQGMDEFQRNMAGVNIPETQVRNLSEKKMDEAKEIAFYIVAFVLYLFILLCGSIITSSVALEKTSRVSDLITYRVSVLKLIYSKVMALYTILLQILCGVAIEVAIAFMLKWINFESISAILNMVGFDVIDIVMICVIIVIGIMVYTVLYVFVGTMIKSAEQIQFSQLPVAAIVLVGFVITVLCRENPEALISKICMYIPTFSPFLAVTRLFEESSQIMEFTLMGISTLVFIIIGNFVIVKVYKRENT